jgi:hypothetical protein
MFCVSSRLAIRQLECNRALLRPSRPARSSLGTGSCTPSARFRPSRWGDGGADAGGEESRSSEDSYFRCLARRDSMGPLLSHTVAPGGPHQAALQWEEGMATDEQDLCPDIVVHSH